MVREGQKESKEKLLTCSWFGLLGFLVKKRGGGEAGGVCLFMVPILLYDLR